MTTRTVEDANQLAPLITSVDAAERVAAELLSVGYRYVDHVDGGFPAWQAAVLPTEPPAS